MNTTIDPPRHSPWLAAIAGSILIGLIVGLAIIGVFGDTFDDTVQRGPLPHSYVHPAPATTP